MGRHIEKQPTTELGLFIRRRREELGLTVQVAAGTANVDYGEWLKIERGERKPMWTTIQRIGFALKVSMTDFPSDVYDNTTSVSRKDAAETLTHAPSGPVNHMLTAIIPLVNSDVGVGLIRDMLTELCSISTAKRNILIRQLMPIAEKIGKISPSNHHETALAAVLDYVRFYRSINAEETTAAIESPASDGSDSVDAQVSNLADDTTPDTA